MKILVTGIAGLIGSRFADYLLNDCSNIEVIGIDNLQGGYLVNVNKKAIFYKCDLSDVQMLNKIFRDHKIDYICHFAAYAAEGLSPFIRNFNYNNNLIASINLINLAIKYNVKRFLFTSSMAVYGKNTIPYVETQNPMPIDPYGIAKFAVEMDLRVANEQHGLEYTIIRPHNVYGKNQNIWDKYRNVLGIWMYQHINNLPLTIFGDGNQKRAFSYIDDCLIPFYNALISDKSKNQIINLGGTKSYTINEACDIFLSIAGEREKLYLEPRHEINEAIPTFNKSIEYLNYTESYQLKDGLIEMWNWAKKQPIRNRFEWSKFELDKNIYSYWESKKD